MLLTEIMPRVESDYRVSTKHSDRAIVGLSMGGLEALSIGLENPRKFDWIGGFSSAVPKETSDNLIARTVVLKLKTKEFHILTRSHTPEMPPSSAEELTRIALSLCDRVNLGRYQRFRLVGVGLSNFRDTTEDDQSILF